MANTYTQCYFHLVFSVKNRDALIRREWKDELERYVTGIVQNHRHKMLAIGTMPDHVHILLRLNIAVRCTFGVILQMTCYKYQAALPQ